MRKKKWIWWHSERAKIITDTNNNVFICNLIDKEGFRHFSFNLNDIESVYVMYEYFKLSGIDTAHTGWAFKIKGKIIIFSPEARKIDTGVYKPVSIARGAFSGYEFIYLLFTDESFDKIKGAFELTSINMTQEQSKKLFIQISTELNRINSKRKRYNILFRNCASQMIKEVYKTSGKRAPIFKKKFLNPLNIHIELQNKLHNI